MHDISQLALASSALKAIADLVIAKDREVRDVLTAEYVEAYKTRGIKSLDVLLDGVKVATVTLTIPKKPAAKVTDSAAFLAWCEANRSDIVVERTERYVPPAAEAQLVAGLVVSDDGEAVDPETGEIVAGVSIPPMPDPKQYSIRYAPDGREILLDRWRAGALASLDDVLALEGSDDDGD